MAKALKVFLGKLSRNRGLTQGGCLYALHPGLVDNPERPRAVSEAASRVLRDVDPASLRDLMLRSWDPPFSDIEALVHAVVTGSRVHKAAALGGDIAGALAQDAAEVTGGDWQERSILGFWQERSIIGFVLDKSFEADFTRALADDAHGAGAPPAALAAFWDEVRSSALDAADPSVELQQRFGATCAIVTDLVLAALTGVGAADIPDTAPPSDRKLMEHAGPLAILEPVVCTGDARRPQVATDRLSPRIPVPTGTRLVRFGRDRRWCEEDGAVSVVPAYDGVSARHCQIAPAANGAWTLEDVGRDSDGSTNGTLVIHRALHPAPLQWCQGRAAHSLVDQTWTPEPDGAVVTVADGDIVCIAPFNGLHRPPMNGLHRPPMNVRGICYRLVLC